MNIYRLCDEGNAFHWVFAESENDARELVVFVHMEMGTDPLVITQVKELSFYDATDVTINDDGTGAIQSLAAEFEMDASRRYVGCSEW